VTSAQSGGALYVVATPIGNLEDLGGRAARVLAEVELILAEDTRHTRRLLEHYRIATPSSALHEHNEARRCAALVRRIAAGARIALVSDAGTPLISDPGYRLVRALREAGLAVICVPGPSAVIAALSVSGLATDRFCFEGFLPARGAARRRRLEALAGEPRTICLFEAPHRLAATLADLAERLGGERRAALARELTKAFEEVRSATLAELREWLAVHPERARGECVLLVEGAPGRAARPALEPEAVLDLLAAELPPRRAAELAARICGVGRNALYRRALARRAGGGQGGAGADL